jgi:transposase/hydroxymethylpyrimidine pyrophosphatase-like HAD family hydrolase
MQGRKDLIPKMLYQVYLDDLVSQNNFYRLLAQELDLHFLYQATAGYYGSEGQESIDPVVFFKICLIGYLNNIHSDRKLIEYCSDSLGIRLFLRYDIDEALPWHSTISRTRQLYGEEVFLLLFRKVLSLCVEKGMVRGKRQAMDSAFIKANAGLDSLLEKEILTDVAVYADELNQNSDFQVTLQQKEQIEQRQNSQEKRSKDHPGADSENAKLLSNTTHYSPTDPDARISTKPGKPRNLNYYGQLAVDTSHHVITGACADFADKKDSQCLQKLCEQTNENLKKNNLKINELLADTGYSSGEALQYLEENNIDAYIPNFGQYKYEREGFIYNKELDQYECQRGNKAILPFKGVRKRDDGYDYCQYRSSESVCKNCPLRRECCGEKTKFKKLSHSIYKEYYDRMHEKLTEKKEYAQKMSRLRSSTVEPVLGTLINFLNMRRVNTRGMNLANKHVLMASLTYNLKKYLKFVTKKAKSQAIALHIEVESSVKSVLSACFSAFGLIFRVLNPILGNSEKYLLKNYRPLQWRF